MQENITAGQRVEKFVFEYLSEGRWQEAAAGTTIGYKRLFHFPKVTADQFRLRISTSRLDPAIGEIGLYHAP